MRKAYAKSVSNLPVQYRNYLIALKTDYTYFTNPEDILSPLIYMSKVSEKNKYNKKAIRKPCRAVAQR